jgi:uncharacterized caspase-like protein
MDQCLKWAYFRPNSEREPHPQSHQRQAHNSLNVVVLDACRDNPFSWARSGTRGLSVLGAQPPGSIIVFATSAGEVAKDGQGRNGVFTSALLQEIKSPGIDIKGEVRALNTFNRQAAPKSSPHRRDMEERS